MTGEPTHPDPNGPVFDVFFSYRHADTEVVLPLVEALRRRGHSVWIDESEIPAFESISGRIQEGLARSKALVAWYSGTYPESRACQWELTQAFISGQRADEPQRRVLLVNPEDGNDHIDPVELRDEKYLVAGDRLDAVAYESLADVIATHLDSLSGTLGALTSATATQWYPRPASGFEHFVGRYREMWRLHTELWKADAPIIAPSRGPNVAQIVGLGGCGKSLLAEEYALRFAAAYPGGVFRLDALGPGPHEPEALANAREDQVRTLSAMVLPEAPGARPLPEVEGMLAAWFEHNGKPFLWLVDDVPSGMATDDLLSWLAPHGLGRTVITTRSSAYASLAPTIDLAGLDEEAAFDLLTRQRTPESEDARETVRAIAFNLGHHALALEVASARLAYCDFAEFLSDLGDPVDDALEFAKEFADELPNGHEASVAGTLLRSLRQLDDTARALLRIAAALGRAEMPQRLLEAALTEHSERIGHPIRRGEAQLGIRNAEKHSLLRRTGTGLFTVHALVSRTVRFRVGFAELLERQQAAAAALARELPLWSGVREHETVRPWIEHARALLPACDEPLTEADLAHAVGKFYAEREDRSSALRYQQRAMEAYRGAVGRDDPRTRQAMRELAETELNHGNSSSARRLLEELREGLTEDHPEHLDLLNFYALTLWADGERSAAREAQEEVLELRRKRLPAGDPRLADAMDNLGNTLARMGDLDAARVLAEEALEISRSARGDDDLETLKVANNLALTLQELGECERACALQEDVLARRRRHPDLGDRHSSTRQAMENLGKTLDRLGESERAAELRAEAHESYVDYMNRNYPVG